MESRRLCAPASRRVCLWHQSTGRFITAPLSATLRRPKSPKLGLHLPKTRVLRLIPAKSEDNPSTWLSDDKAVAFCCLREPPVVGDQNADLVANAESRGEVQGIQTAQAAGPQGSGGIEHTVVEREQRHPLKPRPGIRCMLGRVSLASANRLYCEKGARHVALPLGQLRAQRIVLSLLKRQLHVGRAVQVGQPAGYRRSSRSSSRTSRLGGPTAGGV
jgi:hypothetical protein